MRTLSPNRVFLSPQYVASDDDNVNSPQRGPEDQSEGELSEGEADPADSGLPTLEQLKMLLKEERQDYDAFSLASVSVPTRPWRTTGDSRSSQSQPPDNANVSQARPQAIAKAQSIKSSSSDQRSVQHHADQRQVQLRAPQDQANFPVLVPQGQVQGQRPVLGRPVVRRDDLVSLLDEEFSVDLDNEAVLKEKQARSDILDKIAEFCNLNRQDPRVQKEVMGMRLPAYNAPTKKSIEVSLPWHSTMADIADLNNDIVRGKLNKIFEAPEPI